MNISLILFFCLLCTLLCTLYGIVRSAANTIMATVMLSLLSMILVVLYSILNAPDVALTEAVIGIVPSSVFFVLTANHLQYDTYNNDILTRKSNAYLMLFFVILSCVAVGLFVVNLPQFGTFDTNELYDFYTNKSFADTGIQNIVTAILASYRGFDTMGETTIIAISAIGVYYILHDGSVQSPSP